MSASPSETPKIVLRWRFVAITTALMSAIGIPVALALYGLPLWFVVLSVPAGAALGAMPAVVAWLTQREAFEQMGAPW